MGTSTNFFVNLKNQCRAHDSGRELWEDMYAPNVDQKYIDVPYVEFDLIETHLRFTEKDHQLINQQVEGNFVNLTFQQPKETNYVNEEDMNFWFNQPEGGWRQGNSRYYFLEEVSIHNINWPKLSKIFDGTIRKSMFEFSEGDIIEGYCNSIHLHHGICVDFGSDTLGLLPLNQMSWA